MLYDESVLDDINLLAEDVDEEEDELEGMGYNGTDDDEGDSDWDDENSL